MAPPDEEREAREFSVPLDAERAAPHPSAPPEAAATTRFDADTEAAPVAPDSNGTTIGPWRLLAPLGRGGMGEVWEVERADGVYQQRAALKLLKRGLDSDAILARFRAERQILARLDHPSIARLIDGGVAPDGRPFYVMELVRGEPITEAADAAGLSLRARIELLAVACEAVEAAHRALVVHRDIKPANLLLTGTGEPKLLDFGIAKLLAADESAVRTRFDERILTPAYAAPEQIVGGAITTATDVYALGVVLYELLTGELPHDRAVGSSVELAVAVERETTERPSARVARAERGSAARPRPEELKGDLDAIVLRALAREPARRYATAAALGDDLRRYLDGRPVAARPDSFGYVAGRFVRRHRWGVAAAALVALSLVGGLSAALVSAGRAREAAALATAEAHRAEQQTTRARAEGERATRMKDFLISVFQEASPIQRARGAPLSIEELLDAAERRIDDELADEPLLQADLWDDLAETRASSGDYAAGSKLIDKALAAKRAHLAPDDLSLVESLVNRGAIWNLLATEASRDLEGEGRRVEGTARESLSRELVRRAEAGLAALGEARAILERRGEPDSQPAVNIAVNTVHALLALDRNDEAAVASARATELVERHLPGSPDAAMQHHNSALIALRRGRHEEAKREFEIAIARLETILGPDHALVGLPLLGLADLLENRMDDVAGSIPHYERAVAIARAQYPEGNPERVEKERDLAEARAKLASGTPPPAQ
jgi:tetratricopeptide (TPR) repeat protein/tRNA A-37 threonylcarbamoyl transferase component Bud32